VIFLILGGYVFAYVYNLVPNYQIYTLAVTAVATIMYIGTALGGAVFPWTRKEVYRTAPISKYKVGPIPLITICGDIASPLSATERARRVLRAGVHEEAPFELRGVLRVVDVAVQAEQRLRF